MAICSFFHLFNRVRRTPQRTNAEPAAEEAMKDPQRSLALEAAQETLDSLEYEDCDPQKSSPLFNVLPGELRNEIFKWVLVQYEDEESVGFRENDYHYRPGFHGPHKSSSSLLRSCRLAYCEGRRVIMREAEHAFWFCMFILLLQ